MSSLQPDSQQACSLATGAPGLDGILAVTRAVEDARHGLEHRGARQGPWASAPAEAIRPLSIVIVEDNEDAGLTLRDLLALSGHDVTLTTTGQAGVATALALSPDLLLCDLGLPDMSGYEVIRAIRRTAAGGRLFAAALSGYAQPRDKEVAREAGFDAHLAKPAEVSELSAVLAEVARRKYLRLVGPGAPPSASR